jgi:hypothetical protein
VGFGSQENMVLLEGAHEMAIDKTWIGKGVLAVEFGFVQGGVEADIVAAARGKAQSVFATFYW